MATIEIKHRHGTTLKDAVARTRALLDPQVARYRKWIEDVSWDASAATAKGFGFKGRIGIDESAVSIAVDLGFVARLAKDKVRNALVQALETEFPT